MTASCTILLLEDEPLILMDLEFAGEDRGCKVVATRTCKEALAMLAGGAAIDVAILDVTLANSETCAPVALELQAAGIPFLLHSGDLDRHQERVRGLDAPLVAKPAAAESVIASAIALFRGGENSEERLAAE